jgi:hypothetical protein
MTDIDTTDSQTTDDHDDGKPSRAGRVGTQGGGVASKPTEELAKRPGYPRVKFARFRARRAPSSRLTL